MALAVVLGACSAAACSGAISNVASDAGPDTSVRFDSGSTSIDSGSPDSSSSRLDSGAADDSTVVDVIEEAECSTGATIPLPAPDGSTIPACQACVAAQCCIQQNQCLGDPDLVVTDAGDQAPGCVAYVACQYAYLVWLLAPDADPGPLPVASDCNGYTESSISLGNAFLTCWGNDCIQECNP